MGLFEQFPYTNYHELNLDWIINTFKEKMESAVMSVNGLTGEVTLYQSPYVQFPDIPDTSWNVYRISDGEATGIQFRKGQPAQRIDHVNRYDIYDAGNPPPYPVTTVNGMTGDIYDFFMTSNNILKFPEGTSNVAWELIREIANNTELGLRTQYDSVNDVYEAFICYKETGDIERYVRLLTPNDIPSSSGVVSFNGQTGVVTASGADLNINASDNTSIDQTITNIENDIAIIINGSTSAKNVTAGQYVLVQNSGMTGVPDGLYISNTSVSAGTPFTSAYLDAVTNGGLNSLNDHIAKIESETTLADFTGTTSTTVNLTDTASNYLFMSVVLYDQNGQIVSGVTMPPKFFRNVTAQIYGDSSAVWGTCLLSSDYTQATFNRTSASTSRIRVYGISKIA